MSYTEYLLKSFWVIMKFVICATLKPRTKGVTEYIASSVCVRS